MTDAHTEMQLQMDADAKQHDARIEYLAGIESQVLKIFGESGRKELSARSMRISLNTTSAWLMEVIRNSDNLAYDGKYERVVLNEKGDSDEDIA